MAKSPEEMRQEMIAKLPEKTGKTLAEWQALIRAAGLTRHGEVMKLLKGEHGVSHGYANQIALVALKPEGAPAPGSDGLVDAMYAGSKSKLRPVYEALVKAVKTLGTDVECSPKKAYVSLRRSKQFGLIQPSTAARVDVGLVLKSVAPAGRLEASGSFNAMVTHRVRLATPAEVDAELIAWLRQAYEGA
jgi:hypothetical protein